MRRINGWTREELDQAIEDGISEGWGRECMNFFASLETACMNIQDFLNCEECKMECGRNPNKRRI